MRIPLKTRIHLFFGVVVVGLGIAVGLIFSVLSDQEFDRQVHSQALQASRLLSNQMTERTQQLRSQVGLIAELPTLKSLVLHRVDGETVNDWATDYVQKTGADDLILTTGEGRILGQASKFENRYVAEDLPGLQDAVAGRDWTGVINHKPYPMLGVTVPIVNAGYVVGTLTALRAIDARTATDMHEILGQQVMFVHNRQVIGASLGGQDHFAQLPIEPSRIEIANKDYVALYAPLPRTTVVQGIGFVTLQDYDQIAGSQRQLSIVFICALVTALIAAGAVANRVAGAITSPIDEVVQAAGILQRGEWPEPMKVRRRDEIGFLQTVFNEMAATLKQNRERLLAMIDYDPLTDLFNHRQFLDRLDEEVAKSAASKSDLSLILLDMDDFGKYNQTAGHSSGDDVLKRVSATLRKHSPSYALLARYSGEAFAIVLPGASPTLAASIAEDLRAAIESEFEAENLTASLGCAHFEPVGQTAPSLVLAAEFGVSRAKQFGKNRVVTSDDDTEMPSQLNDLASGDLATIQALAAAVDAKDSYTQGHSIRVAEYAYDLARYLNASDAEAKLIYRTGTLHDVGKIGVPDAILKKPSKLTPEEFEIMKTHSVLGEVIVRKVPELADTLPGVRHHHERWDGAGYPDRLKGEEIPRVARFLAIADTFDAMTTSRTYRAGMTPETAVDEIERCAGSQFDPELALAFARMMRKRLLKVA